MCIWHCYNGILPKYNGNMIEWEDTSLCANYYIVECLVGESLVNLVTRHSFINQTFTLRINYYTQTGGTGWEREHQNLGVTGISLWYTTMPVF